MLTEVSSLETELALRTSTATPQTTNVCRSPRPTLKLPAPMKASVSGFPVATAYGAGTCDHPWLQLRFFQRRKVREFLAVISVAICVQ